MKPVYVYRARALRVVDGDTFIAEVDLGFRVSAAIEVRLRGVNTPEGLAGLSAKEFLANLLGIVSLQIAPPHALVLQSYKDRRSFTRWICDVWLDSDKSTLAERIIAAGYGTPFDPCGWDG